MSCYLSDKPIGERPAMDDDRHRSGRSKRGLEEGGHRPAMESAGFATLSFEDEHAGRTRHVHVPFGAGRPWPALDIGWAGAQGAFVYRKSVQLSASSESECKADPVGTQPTFGPAAWREQAASGPRRQRLRAVHYGDGQEGLNKQLDAPASIIRLTPAAA